MYLLIYLYTYLSLSNSNIIINKSHNAIAIQYRGKLCEVMSSHLTLYQCQRIAHVVILWWKKNIKYHNIYVVVGWCVPLCSHTVHIIDLYFVSITLLKIVIYSMLL